jgi:hypothetical protein
MRRNRGLLDDATLDGIVVPSLTDEQRALASREYGICVILDRIAGDKELRKRVRKLLDGLPADKPGPEPVMDDSVLYRIIEAMRSNGYSLAKSFKLLSREGLSEESLKTKYKKGKKKASAKKGTEK